MKHLKGDDPTAVGVKNAVAGPLSARGDLFEGLVAAYALLLHVRCSYTVASLRRFRYDSSHASNVVLVVHFDTQWTHSRKLWRTR